MVATAATNASWTRQFNQRAESRKHTNNRPLMMPVNSASITAAKPVAHGAVSH